MRRAKLLNARSNERIRSVSGAVSLSMRFATMALSNINYEEKGESIKVRSLKL